MKRGHSSSLSMEARESGGICLYIESRRKFDSIPSDPINIVGRYRTSHVGRTPREGERHVARNQHPQCVAQFFPISRGLRFLDYMSETFKQTPCILQGHRAFGSDRCVR